MPKPHGRRIGCDYCAIYPEMENPAGYRKEMVTWEHGDERHVAALYAEGNDFVALHVHMYKGGKLYLKGPHIPVNNCPWCGRELTWNQHLSRKPWPHVYNGRAVLD